MKFKRLTRYAEKYNFDIVPFNNKKRPIGVPNWADPSVMCRTIPMVKKVLDQAPCAAIVMKNETGISVNGGYLMVLDIDDKQKTGKGSTIYNDLIDSIASEFGIPIATLLSMSESTMNGGYHVFLYVDELAKTRRITVEAKVDIEIFSVGRTMTTSPSDGYKVSNGDPGINFDNVFKTKLSYKELEMKILDRYLPACYKKPKDKWKFREDSNVTENWEKDQNKIQRVQSEWPEFVKFSTGTSNTDWDNICPNSSVYDYVRFNLMPWFIITGQTEDFIRIIKQYNHGAYLAEWAKYPKKWIEADPSEQAKGAEVRQKLVAIGYLRKGSPTKETAQEFLKRYLTDIMPELFGECIVIEDMPYRYDYKLHHYTPLTDTVISNILLLHLLKTEGMVMSDSRINSMIGVTVKYMKAFSTDEDYQGFDKYSITEDQSYLNEIPIVFNNGTLYLRPCTSTFARDQFSKEDKALYKIHTDYHEGLLTIPKDSVIMEWLHTKFPQQKVVDFIQMYFASLLVPAHNPEVMLTIVTEQGGTGKSTLNNTLARIFDPPFTYSQEKKVTYTCMSQLGDKFKGWDLCSSILNISNEADSRLDSEYLKSLISREPMQVERKNKDAYYIKPLAKHLATANKVPTILPDGGVIRRLATFTASPTPVRPEVEATTFGNLFAEDWTSLLSFMLLGVQKLLVEGFPNLSKIWIKDMPEHKNLLLTSNSPSANYLRQQGYRELLNAGEEGLKLTDMHTAYKLWCEKEGIPKSKIASRTYLKNDLKKEGYADYGRVNGKYRVTILETMRSQVEELLSSLEE